MFKLINILGKLVAKLYVREAKRLNDRAQKDSAEAQRLARETQRLADSARDGVTKAAKVAADGMAIGKFFK